MRTSTASRLSGRVLPVLAKWTHEHVGRRTNAPGVARSPRASVATTPVPRSDPCRGAAPFHRGRPSGPPWTRSLPASHAASSPRPMTTRALSADGPCARRRAPPPSARRTAAGTTSLPCRSRPRSPAGFGAGRSPGHLENAEPGSRAPTRVRRARDRQPPSPVPAAVRVARAPRGGRTSPSHRERRAGRGTRRRTTIWSVVEGEGNVVPAADPCQAGKERTSERGDRGDGRQHVGRREGRPHRRTPFERSQALVRVMRSATTPGRVCPRRRWPATSYSGHAARTRSALSSNRRSCGGSCAHGASPATSSADALFPMARDAPIGDHRNGRRPRLQGGHPS